MLDKRRVHVLFFGGARLGDGEGNVENVGLNFVIGFDAEHVDVLAWSWDHGRY